MVMNALLSLLAAAAAATGTPGLLGSNRCAAELQIRANREIVRPIEARDLIELIDIGSISDFEESAIFAPSPDGEEIAIPVRRANVESNGYCSGVYVVSLDGKARLVDAGWTCCIGDTTTITGPQASRRESLSPSRLGGSRTDPRLPS
jgi:hypothetical protein